MPLIARLLLQYILDLVVDHAFKMSGPAMNGSLCMYRADKTAACPHRCFIGALIKDDEYDPDNIEGGPDASFPPVYKLVASFLGVELTYVRELAVHRDGRSGLLKDLQMIHDAFGSPHLLLLGTNLPREPKPGESWHDWLNFAFAEFAAKHSLRFNPR